MKKLLQRIKTRVQLNNRGTSLVELIVALLILMIVTVSLLQMFTSASRVNTVNARNVSADAVAENVMEAVKTFGIKNSAIEIWKYNTGENAKCFGMDGITASDDSLNNAGDPHSSAYKKPGTAEWDFAESDKKVYEYTLSGVTEGRQDFDVKITFDSNYTKAGFNDKTVYDYDAFSEEEDQVTHEKKTKTAYINPLISGMYYDEAAIEWFRLKNVQHKSYLFETDKASAEDHNLEEARKKLRDPSYTENIWSVPSGSEAKYQTINKYSDLIAKIDRELIITISNETDSATPENYLINAEFKYTMPEEDVGSGNTEYSGTGFCTSVGYEKLKYIYMFYVPFPYMCESAFDNDVRNAITGDPALEYTSQYKTDHLLRDLTVIPMPARQKITVNNETTDLQKTDTFGNIEKPLEVYIAAQGAIEDSSNSLATATTGNAPVMYSNVQLAYAPGFHQGLIKQYGTETKQIIYNVTIEVSNEEGVLRTLKSTIAK